MSDPRDAMLNAARALHDRAPDDLGHCLTCHDDEGACVPWPCHTAIALGATGRSEWATTLCTHWDGSFGPWHYACTLYAGHAGDHDHNRPVDTRTETYIDQYGNTMWHDYTDRDTCGNQYENDICHLQRRHDGACSYSPINAPRCSPQCAREAGHPGIHVHPDGTRR